MDTKVLKDMITVIRTEQERRAKLLQDSDPDIAYDKWLFTDGPFLNELCLIFGYIRIFQSLKYVKYQACSAFYPDFKCAEFCQFLFNVSG